VKCEECVVKKIIGTRNQEPIINNWQISSCNLWKTIIVSSTYGTCYSSDF
jgi:hypothetical protein